MLLAATLPSEVYTEPSILQVILIYAGIPALVIIAVVLLVYAPSWTRQGRTQPGKSWDTESLLLGGDAGSEHVPGPTGKSGERPDSTGGTSATW
jgi:hypothetical protein